MYVPWKSKDHHEALKRAPTEIGMFVFPLLQGIGKPYNTYIYTYIYNIKLLHIYIHKYVQQIILRMCIYIYTSFEDFSHIFSFLSKALKSNQSRAGPFWLDLKALERKTSDGTHCLFILGLYWYMFTPKKFAEKFREHIFMSWNVFFPSRFFGLWLRVGPSVVSKVDFAGAVLYSYKKLLSCLRPSRSRSWNLRPPRRSLICFPFVSSEFRKKRTTSTMVFWKICKRHAFHRPSLLERHGRQSLKDAGIAIAASEIWDGKFSKTAPARAALTPMVRSLLVLSATKADDLVASSAWPTSVWWRAIASHILFQYPGSNFSTMKTWKTSE